MLRQFYVPCPTVAISDMNTTLLRTRQMSLALLVTAVVEAGQTPGSSDACNANSSPLLRLGHELIRSAGVKKMPRHR